MIKLIKYSRYLIEAILVKLFMIIFTAIGRRNASKLAGSLSTFIGGKLSVNKLAINNIKKALPKEKNHQKIIKNMWQNLGQICGEYVHISKIPSNKITKYIHFSEETKANLKKMANSKKGGIIFSGHIGNWEIGPKSLIANNLKIKTFYRPLNNFLVEKITAKMRKTPLITKNNGIREIVRSIAQGYYIVFLVDQKITQGQKIPFFNQEAYTSDLIAKIALKYQIDLIGARVIRNNQDFNFTVQIDKPLKITKTDNAKSIMTKINAQLESWIKQYPDQWFWVHNRWKK